MAIDKLVEEVKVRPCSTSLRDARAGDPGPREGVGAVKEEKDRKARKKQPNSYL